jgi:hypothetical protein
MSILVQDCLDEINRHLSLVQLLTVRKYRLWYVKPVSIRTIVINRLVELGYDLDVATDIINAVHKSKSILSGPFMLLVLVTPLDAPLELNPENIPRNFDIYTNLHVSEELYPSMMIQSAYSCARNHNWDDIKNTSIISRPLPKTSIEETIFDPPVDDIARKLFNGHNFCALKVAYNGNTLFIKELECVLTEGSSLNSIRNIELDYNKMIFKNIKGIRASIFNQIHTPAYELPDEMPELEF